MCSLTTTNLKSATPLAQRCPVAFSFSKIMGCNNRLFSVKWLETFLERIKQGPL